MNPRIMWAGLGILIAGAVLLTFPLATTGVEQADLELQLGVFVLPAGLAILLSGATAPNPERTTVGGLFGSGTENFLRRHVVRSAPPLPTRLLPHPQESVNCPSCYTAISADAIECPRCGRSRSCRVCAGALELLKASPGCTTCGRAEVYCDCPKLRKAKPVGGLGHPVPH